MIREFEIREKGREFFHNIYGLVATLSDFSVSILRRDNSGMAMILTEEGFTRQPMAELIKRYKKEYDKYADFWYEVRKKGLEVFLSKDFKDTLKMFWGVCLLFLSERYLGRR